MLKKAQVIMLPTEKGTSSIAKSINHNILSLYNKNDDKYNQWINQNLYITSDDEIKEGDWFIDNNQIFKCNDIKLGYWNVGESNKSDAISSEFRKHEIDNCKKIIATTDTNISSKEITPFGRQFIKPSQQFIEKYIESYNAGQVINDVLVEYEDKFIGKCIPDENGCHCYDKNIVKINPKDNTITIKKLKDSWNREEVIILLNKLNNTLNIGSDLTLEQWIEKNL